jgi:hypothetical protein
MRGENEAELTGQGFLKGTHLKDRREEEFMT